MSFEGPIVAAAARKSRADVELAQQRAMIAALGPNGGYLTWRSSPHVLALAWILNGGNVV